MKYLVAVLMALASPAMATTPPESAVEFIRCVDSFSGTRCEFVPPSEMTQPLTCVAWDDEGRPLATTITIASFGTSLFRDMSSTQIEDVTCR